MNFYRYYLCFVLLQMNGEAEIHEPAEKKMRLNEGKVAAAYRFVSKIR